MKAKNSILFGLILIVAVFTITGCNKKLKRTDSKLKEIEEPFSSKKYFSDKKHFRATGEGRAMDLTVAKRIAETNARQAIASQIQVKVRSVGEQFLQNRNIDNKLETQSKFEDLTRTVIDQTLNRVEIFDSKSFQNKKGEYVHYVAMEMSTSQIENDLADGISQDQRLKQDFDLMKFREIYQQELEEFSEENR
jgi:hypothetical protein